MKTLFIHCKIWPHFVHRWFAEKINAEIVKCCKRFGNINIFTQIIESFIRWLFYATYKYEVIICEWMEAIYLWAFVKIFSKKTKIIYHDADAFFYRDYSKFTWFKKRIIDYFLNQIDYIISDSEISKWYINKFINKPTEVVYPFVDVEKFQSISRNNSQNKNIIYIWRFAEEKNIFELLKAFKKLNTENSHIKLRLIWKWPLKKEIINFIKANHIKNTEIISRTDNLWKYLNDSFIWYNVSDFEPFGCNWLEYALSWVIPLLWIDNGNKEIFSRTDIISKKDFESIYKNIKYFMEINNTSSILKELQKDAEKYKRKSQTQDFENKFNKLIWIYDK